MMNINLIPFPTLTTHRLILRRLNANDVSALQKLRSDDEVNKYLNRPKSITIPEAEAYILKIDDMLSSHQCVYWVISLKSAQRFIGTICLWNFSPEKDIAELGYELSPASQGQGIMQEAVEKIIAYGFDSMRLKVITALMNPENERSVRVLQRNHFKEDPDYRYTNQDESRGLLAYFLLANA